MSAIDDEIEKIRDSLKKIGEAAFDLETGENLDSSCDFQCDECSEMQGYLNEIGEIVGQKPGYTYRDLVVLVREKMKGANK